MGRLTKITGKVLIEFKGSRERLEKDSREGNDRVCTLRTPIGNVAITKLEAEDGSGRSWNLKGFIVVDGLLEIPVSGYYRDASNWDKADGYGTIELASFCGKHDSMGEKCQTCESNLSNEDDAQSEDMKDLAEQGREYREENS